MHVRKNRVIIQRITFFTYNYRIISRKFFKVRLKTACKAKSLINVIMLLPRQGAIYSIIYHLPRALPWAGISLAFL